MQKLGYLLLALLCVSCKFQEKETVATTTSTSLTYATGFKISEKENYTVITVTNAWPGTNKTFTYALANDVTAIKNKEEYDAVVKTPLQAIVVTSTTHIPSLEMLEETQTLVGFPHLDYISSAATRLLINEGKVKDVGANEALNTELLIDLNPDAVVSFAVNGENTTLNTLQKTAIPVLINADWTEKHPLGKAEWIKFFGVLFNKKAKADSIFKSIETTYNNAKSLAKSATKKPTVLSGAMYKDVWYMPQGDSWAAQFIKDANGRYLWEQETGTGSIALNLESVLEKGQQAQIWLGPAQFTSKTEMLEFNPVYGEFEAFKNNFIYSFTNKKGETGGVLYYELAPNRPDIVLKDVVKILHPQLLPDHELYFFTKIK